MSRLTDSTRLEALEQASEAMKEFIDSHPDIQAVVQEHVQSIKKQSEAYQKQDEKEIDPIEIGRFQGLLEAFEIINNIGFPKLDLDLVNSQLETRNGLVAIVIGTPNTLNDFKLALDEREAIRLVDASDNQVNVFAEDLDSVVVIASLGFIIGYCTGREGITMVELELD